VVAYTAHYYGQSPLAIETWKTSQIDEWYNEAVKLEKEKWKAVNSGEKS
jgi:hypothetical protein